MPKFIEEEKLDTAIMDSEWVGVANLIVTLYGVHVEKKSDEALIIVNNAIAKLPFEGLIVLAEISQDIFPDLCKHCEDGIDSMILAAENYLEGGE